MRGNQFESGDHSRVAGNVFKAVLAATALALVCAWLALPGPAVAQTQFTLTVTLAGGGTGSVHDTNFHIACPTDCSGTQSCIVTMNADEAVTATFLAPGYGTLTAPVPKTRKHRQIRTKVTTGWRWDARRTVLTRLSFSNLPGTARILTTCTGKRCPFKSRTGTAGSIKAFERGLVGSAFVSGDKLMLTISAPGRRAERVARETRRARAGDDPPRTDPACAAAALAVSDSAHASVGDGGGYARRPSSRIVHGLIDVIVSMPF